jgi:hypothetical protein
VKRACVVAVLCLVLSPVAAAAQERGQVGVTMGFPASVGFIWHATDRVALRPEIDFAFGSSKSDINDNITTESDSRAFSIGASLLWYLTPAAEHVHPYISPRVVFFKSTSERDDLPDADSDGLDLSASFGVQYAPVPHFSVFGEVGIVYTNAEGSFGDSQSSSTAFGTRTAVGVIYYFSGM